MILGHLVNKRMFLPLGRLFGSQRVRREQGKLAKGKTLGGCLWDDQVGFISGNFTVNFLWMLVMQPLGNQGT